MTHKHAHRSRYRHGLSSVLAMLYLVLFSTLAVGFAAATAMNAQISRNERALQQADAAADGGMQFIRYQLGQMSLGTVTPTNLLTSAQTALASQMNGTANMIGASGTTYTVQITGSGATSAIYIPAASDWTTLDSTLGTKFRAKITQSGSFLIVTVDGGGPNSAVEKAIQLQYQEAPLAGAILDYGVATEGTLSTAGSTVIQGLTDPTKGSVLSADMTSATPVSISGKSVSGDISIVNPSGTINVAGASVGGTTNPVQMASHLHVGVQAPVFPTVDTTVFQSYATNAYPSSGTTFTDVTIPAGKGTSASPLTITNATINGVLFIKAPNVIKFAGNTTICGVIVTETGSSAPAFNASTNFLTFTGNVTATPIQNMPSTNPAYNASLVAMTGSFMLAPNFAVTMTGNFGTIGGSMVVGQLSMSGNASGTVQGSVIGMQDVAMGLTGSADIYISSTGTSNYPSGLSFGNNYVPLPGTYLEVQPW